MNEDAESKREGENAMKYSMPILALAALAVLFQMPQTVHAQKNKEIVDLQRYIFDLERSVKQIQGEQAEKIAELEALQREQLKAIADLGSQIKGMQQSLTQALTEQQNRVAEPMAVVRTSVDSTAQGVTALQATQAETSRRLSSIETSLSDLTTLVKTLNVAAPAPPPPPGEGGILSEQGTLFTSAQRDFLAGRNELAYNGFVEFVKQYPTAPEAPQAYWHIGEIFMRNKQYKDAVDAYDRGIEPYPDNTYTSELLFSKAVALQAWNKKDEAIAEFRTFLQKFPGDPKRSSAEEKLRELGARP